ncbi:queuine tRNA-ribosyltransferase catalytic subunit 1-like protein [Tanacetum coccineum]
MCFIMSDPEGKKWDIVFVLLCETNLVVHLACTHAARLGFTRGELRNSSHKRPKEQNLFGIVQGGLDPILRDTCVRGLVERNLPGLAGGEDKDSFWRVVTQCTASLPESKPRYVMGVLRLKHQSMVDDTRPIDSTCECMVCKNYTMAYLHCFVTKEAMGSQLLSYHNLHYMLQLSRNLHSSIIEGTFPEFVCNFLMKMFPEGDIPEWVCNAIETLLSELSNEVGFPVTNTSFDALLKSLLSTAKPFPQSAGYRILVINMPRATVGDTSLTRSYIPKVSQTPSISPTIAHFYKPIEDRCIHKGRVVDQLYYTSDNIDRFKSLFKEMTPVIESARATPKAHLLYGMFLTRLFRHVMEHYPHLDNGIYNAIDRIMRPLTLKQTRKPRSDRGKARHSVSLTFAHHNHGSSSRQGDNDEDDGSSRASTPSPTTYLNSLKPLNYQ